MSKGIGDIPESRFQKKVIESVKKQYGFVFENKGSSIQRRGIPDLQIQLPWLYVHEDRCFNQESGEFIDSTVNLNIRHIIVPGGMIWLELKVHDGRVGAHQRKMMEEIRKAGGLAMICKLHHSGEIKTWEINQRTKKYFSSFLGTKHFSSGLWLRQILQWFGSESPSQKYSIKRIPTSYAKAFLDPSPDA